MATDDAATSAHQVILQRTEVASTGRRRSRDSLAIEPNQAAAVRAAELFVD